MNVLELNNRCLKVRLIPELGGKIVSLASSGQEWLWHARPGAPMQPTGKESDFALVNLGGIDECLPTIREQTFGEWTYSDHGQVWRLPARVTEQATDCVVTESLLDEAPLHFRREIRLEGDSVFFRNVVANVGEASISWFRAFHPLFRIEPGDRIKLSPELQPMRVEYVLKLPGCTENASFDWPRICPGMDLENAPLDGASGFCVKLFFRSARTNTATLIRSKGGRLTMEWDGKESPFFGLWLTAGGWNGHTHLAFEPTNYPADVFLPEILPPPLLPPGEEARWSLRVRFPQKKFTHRQERIGDDTFRVFR